MATLERFSAIMQTHTHMFLVYFFFCCLRDHDKNPFLQYHRGRISVGHSQLQTKHLAIASARTAALPVKPNLTVALECCGLRVAAAFLLRTLSECDSQPIARSTATVLLAQLV
eukprot:5738762-Amphidinium_carterae.1